MISSDGCQEKEQVKNRNIKLVALNSRFIHSSLALFYIREELEKYDTGHGYDVELYQGTINDNYYDTLLNLTAGQPYAIFLSANIWNSLRVEQLARDINLALPACNVVIGGPQASVLAETLAEEDVTIVAGEIEAVGQLFHDDLAAGNLQEYYSGSFLASRPGELKSPYRDADFGDQLKNRHIYYESSRGCPHNCSYCLSAAESGLFHKPLDQVKEELVAILQHEPKVVRFIDRTFNDLPGRALEIWKFLLDRKEKTLFHFEMAPDRFTDEMFELLEGIEPGRFQFEIGVQSTNPQTLGAIRRRVDHSKVQETLQRLASLQAIHLHVDLILGLPFETEETFGRSFEDVFYMGAHYIQMGLLKILPGTPIERESEFGYCWSSTPPYSVFANRWLDHSQLSDLYWFCEGVEKFHNNRYFVSVWRYLRNTREPIYRFFDELILHGRSKGLFELAPTQEFLTRLILDMCLQRKDSAILVDLLRYDWLRCGFRKLPPSLAHRDGAEGPEMTRDKLFAELPENIAGLFDRHNRNSFFRKSVFLHLGADACRILGLGDTETGCRLVFFTERENTLHSHNRVAVVE